MTVRYRFPDELTTEATSLSATDDWVVVQKAGESQLKKAHPSTINVPDTLDSDLTTIANLSHSAGRIIVSNGSAWTATNTIVDGWRLATPGATGPDPTYSSQSDPDTGVCFYSANVVGFTTAGSARCGVGSSGNFVPITDNSYSLGSSGARWVDVWALDSTINTSDATLKTAIENTDLGLDFILELRPVRYRWLEAKKHIEPQWDDNGERLADIVTNVPGVRQHYGLLAQDVATVLDGHDFAGYINDAETGIKGLRYSEFIAPLIKAIQELEERLAALEVGS